MFGEYSVIVGSKALALPYSKYWGHWSHSGKTLKTSVGPGFYQFIVDQEIPGKVLDIELFTKNQSERLDFVSNIPRGYGLGSSAAFTAAVYDLFAKDKKNDLVDIKSELSAIESYHHGSSSGIDPLVSYLDMAVLLDGDQIVIQESWNFHQYPFQMFLLDSRQKRNTEGLVRSFLRKYRSKKIFRKAVQNTLNPLYEQAIELLTKIHQPEHLMESWAAISDFQYQFFKEMIPESILPLWKTGLDSGDFALKLCGAGGGGYFLGIKRTDAEVAELENWSIVPLE